MAQLYSSGAVHVWVSFPTRRPREDSRDPADMGELEYVGTGLVAPESTIIPTWNPVFTDSGGSALPVEVLGGLEHAYTIVDLTRFREDCIRKLQARPYARATDVRGFIRRSDAHTMMFSENRMLTLYLLYTRRSVPAMNGVMIPGLRFPNNTILEGRDARKTGTRTNTVRLLFHSYPYYDKFALNAFGEKLFNTYDYNVTRVANRNPD